MHDKKKRSARKYAGGGYVYPPVPPAVQAIAEKYGLKASTGRGGSLFFRGAAGEQLALKPGSEFLDLISIGAEKTKGGGKRLLGVLDEAASALGLQARRGTTNLSATGQASLERGTQQGFLARNPAGPGFLSTAQPAGNAAMIDELVSNIGPKAPSVGQKVMGGLKGAASGVTALLEPMWGAIQNSPEGQELLRNSPMAGVIPQRGYQSGGPVPKSNSSNGTKIRIPTKQLIKGMAGGGRVQQGAPTSWNNRPIGGAGGTPIASQQPNQNNVVGQTINTIQGIQPNTTAITNTANQLGNYNPNIQAQTGPMNQTAQQLGQFNPLTGPAGETLQGMVATGNAVDVNPLTQVAQQQAQRGFGDFMGQANEQFGALGLGSSSARTAALGREAGRLQQGIGEAGITAGVQSQENARQRQLQAFNPLLQGSGQQLSGMQTAGALQGQAAGLGLEGQVAKSGQQLSGLQSAGQLHTGAAGMQLEGQIAKAGQFNQLGGNLIPQAVGVNQRPMPGGASGGSAFSGGAGSGTVPRPRNPYLGQQGGVVTPEGIERYARGGRVDLGDYLGNLTFGQKFTRPPQDDYRYASARGPTSFDRNRATRDSSREQAQRMELARLPYQYQDRAERRDKLQASGAAQAMAQGLMQGPRSYLGGVDPYGSLANTIGAIGVPAAQKGLAHSYDLISQGGGSSPSMAQVAKQQSQQKYKSGLESNQQTAMAKFLMNQGINPATGQRLEHGGEIEGPSYPPDQVPIMAQGGEGVIPLRLMAKLERSKSSNPLIRELQQLMGKEPQLNDRDIQRKQRGGKIAKVMHEFKAGTLRSGGPNGPSVTDRKQAIAIALSEAREMQHGGQIPTAKGNQFLRFVGPPQPSDVPSFKIEGDPNAPPEISPGRNIDPTENAQLRYEQARGKSSLLRTLAAKSPRGALAKLSPLINQAEAEEQDAAKGLEESISLKQQAEISALERQTRLDVATQGVESARVRGAAAAALRPAPQSALGADIQSAISDATSQAPESIQQQGVMGAQAPQMPVSQVQAPTPQPDPIEALFSIEDPAELESNLAQIDWTKVQPDLRSVQLARERVKQLILSGAGEEELMLHYSNLYKLAGG